MLLKPSSRSTIWVLAILVSLISIFMLVSCSTAGSSAPSEEGSAGQGDSSADSGSMGEPIGESAESEKEFEGEGTPISSCPEGPIFMDVEMIGNWTWSPGGISELGKIDGWGRVTCIVEISGSEVAGEVGCYFEYSNDGFIQGDPGRCDIKGQGVAITTITGSCDDFTVTLQIDETVEPDEETGDVPMTADMKCGEKTYPYITYFPFTWFEVEVPLADGTFETSLGKADCPTGFIECDKIYTFRLHGPE
jgi:hypothetical protein